MLGSLIKVSTHPNTGERATLTHVFDSSNVLSTLKVLARLVGATLPGIVHEVFGHFAQSSTFLAKIDDNAAPALLCFDDGLLYSENEVGTTCTSEVASAADMRSLRDDDGLYMSEPKTSLPLHSSWTRRARRFEGSAILAGSPKQYTVRPPIGGRKTLISGRVMSSGYEPPVFSNNDLRNEPSSAL